MSQLQRVDRSESLDVFGRPRDIRYVEAVALAISLMHEALHTFGKKIDGLCDSWELGLRTRGVRIEEIPLATAAFVGGLCGPNFPTPGEFADWVLANRRWSVGAEVLKATEEASRRENEEARCRFNERLVSRYGSCDIDTVHHHLTQLGAGRRDVFSELCKGLTVVSDCGGGSV